MSPDRPRWFTDHRDDHSRRYVERFRALSADGADLDGEARLVDALLARGSRVLDAGCGPGRVGAALHHRGHQVVGVDVDPVLVAAARADHPGPTWIEADLATLDLTGSSELSGSGGGDAFDAAVLAGNVMVFLAPGTEVVVLRRIAAHIRNGGKIITGFATDRPYDLAGFDRDCAAAGLVLEHRFATWDLAPWRDDAGWAVSILRR